MPIKKANDIRALTEARLNLALRPFVGQPLTEDLISKMQKQASFVANQLAQEYGIERPAIRVARDQSNKEELRIVIE